jgi:hypothetical protein
MAEQRGYIAEHGAPISDRLSRAFQTPWPAVVPVATVAHASWAGAFQTDTPLLVHISSGYEAHQGSGGLEQLYHEAGHAIDDSVFRALRGEAQRLKKSVRRGFWQELTHLILFYTAGYSVRERIPEHVPYAERWGVAERSRAEYALLHEHWRPYLEGQITFADAISRLVRDAPER